MPTCGGGSCCSCKKLPVTMAIEGALRQAALWTQPGSNTGRNLQPRRHRLEEERFSLPFRPLAGLAQEQEPGVRGGAARGRGELGKREMAPTGKNRIMIYGPKTDGSY